MSRIGVTQYGHQWVRQGTRIVCFVCGMDGKHRVSPICREETAEEQHKLRELRGRVKRGEVQG